LKQMAIRCSFAKSTGGKLVPPPQCYQHSDSCDNDSVAANKSNICGQRSSINADNAENTDNAEDITKDTDNAQPTERWTAPITERMLRERIELLACANTHGKSSSQWVGVMCVLTIYLKRKHFWQGKRTLQRKQN
jgi:hypothetical protein